MASAFEIVAFGVLSFIAIAGALGMTTTMSMFRSGIFLMASFFGVAGLFILLSADLIGILQIMMYVGGMLIMILFMVLFMHDPGGAMMAGMAGMAPLERWFSKGLVPRAQDHDERHGGESHEGHQHHHAHDAHHAENHGSHGEHRGMGMQHMDMSDMSMVTPVRRLAAWLAVVVGVFLVALIALRPAWHLSPVTPDPESARRVGHLLMEKYMAAFEGAGVLILIGIFGAVLLARPSVHPDDPSRSAQVAVADNPPPIEDDRITPLAATRSQQRGEHP